MTKKNRKGFDIEFIHDGIEFCFRELGFHDLSQYGVQRDSEDANTLIIGEFCVIDTPAPDAVDQRAKILAMYYIPAQTGGRPEDATPADTDFRLISTAHNNEEAIRSAVEHVFQRVLDEALYAFGMEWEMSVDESEKLSKVRLRVPDACPGCGKLPGQGLTEDCTHEIGCGYWRKANGGEE